jgi:hypothetical protein
MFTFILFICVMKVLILCFFRDKQIVILSYLIVFKVFMIILKYFNYFILFLYYVNCKNLYIT